MTRNIKLAAVVAAGFASAAIAQPASPQAQSNAPAADRPGHMMGQGGQMGHGMMMNDPEVRAEMVQMMKNCSRMMERVSDGQRPAQKPNG